MGGITWRKAMERGLYIPSRKVLMALEYRGYDFRGTQADRALEIKEERKFDRVLKPSVQYALEWAYVRQKTGVMDGVQFATRTDTGVNATFNVCEASIGRRLTPKNIVQDFILPMNRNLVDTYPVRIMAAACVDEVFSASRQAVSKTYRYVVCNTPSRTAGLDLFKGAWNFSNAHRLDVPKMDAAAKATLLGRHAFSSFTTSKEVQNLKSTICHVTDVAVTEADPPPAMFSRFSQMQIVHIDVTANRFLPGQMMTIAAALVSVGKGSMSIEQMVEGRNEVSPTAFAHCLKPPKFGLYVHNIEFKEDEVEWVFPERSIRFDEEQPNVVEVEDVPMDTKV